MRDVNRFGFNVMRSDLCAILGAIRDTHRVGGRLDTSRPTTAARGGSTAVTRTLGTRGTWTTLTLKMSMRGIHSALGHCDCDSASFGSSPWISGNDSDECSDSYA